MISKRLGVEHFGYKIIALLITMILWVTVVSQRQMVVTQKLSVQFIVPGEFQIEGSQQVEAEIQLEGARPLLKRYLQRSWPSAIIVPLRAPLIGLNPAEIPVSDLQLPAGIKVLSIHPREVVLQVKAKAKK
jgi:YbbR domain-containing protein